MAQARPEADLYIAEQAAHWLIELEDASPGTLADFGVWLEASPRHVEEFLLASAVWKAFDGFDAERRIEIQKLIESAGRNVLDLPARAAAVEAQGQNADRESRGVLTRTRVLMGAIAATLLGVVVLWVLSSAASGTYATARGEQRALKLDDGSVIYLNTESRVEVHLSSTERSVRLRAGEALFRVAHDAHRPFRVIADDAVIQAIGTEFNVYRATGGTTVSVVEGVVQIMHSAAAAASPTRAAGPTPVVSASQITAGEQARVSAAGAIVKQTHADLQRAVAWRERRLVFRGDTLEDVAREFNRYNTLQIQIEDASVRDRRLTATFDADDPQSLVLFLQKSGDLRVDEHGQVVSIYSN